MKPRAVLDTSILVRALLGGEALDVFRALDAGLFEHVSSEPILAELEDVLRRPRLRRFSGMTLDDIRRDITRVRAAATDVVPGHLVVRMVPTDPKDDPVVAAALEGRATYIVTGDQGDLLSLKTLRVSGYPVIQIERPRAFLRLIGA